LNFFYKKGTSCLKVFPWILIPLAIITTAILFFLFGKKMTLFVNQLAITY